MQNIFWLVLSYKVPTEPSRKRVYVWRKLKELGALYLQQGVGILPETANYEEILQGLRKEIMDMDGEGVLARLSFLNEEDERRIIEAFQAARNEEYDEIIEQCEKLIQEIEREEQRGKYTFAEVEENEAELAKIQKWMEKVVARDFFKAPKRLEAKDMISQASQSLNDYIQKVYEKEG